MYYLQETEENLIFFNKIYIERKKLKFSKQKTKQFGRSSNKVVIIMHVNGLYSPTQNRPFLVELKTRATLMLSMYINYI